MYLYGLSKPLGSNIVLMRRIMSIDVGDCEYETYGAFITPRPCSAEMDPPFSAGK